MTKALLVIDVQNGMFDPNEPVKDGNTLLDKLKEAIHFCQSKGWLVVYIQHTDESLPEGSPQWEIHPAIAPAKDNNIIMKTAPDSFYRTGLDGYLREQKIEHLIIAGIQTEVCVDTTVRSAVSKDYKVTLISDAHGTWDSPELSSEQIINHHNRTLNWLTEVKALQEFKEEMEED